MSLKPITRDALGRPLCLGGLYNACTDETLPGAMFKVKNVEQSKDTEVDIQYYFEDDDSEKFRKLDVEAELSVSLKCGLVKFSGQGSYFSSEESKQRTVKATLSYRWKTLYESFNHLDSSSADLFQGVEAEYFATHFVQGIQYGGAIYITFESKVCDHTEVEQIKGEMDATIELLIGKIRGSASEEFSQEVKDRFSSFKIDMKGTLKDNCLSTDPSDIIQFISQIPKQQETINDGKGVPLKYTLYPLAAYEKCKNMKIERLLGTVDDIVLSKTANNLTEFERLKKEVKILQALGASAREFTPPTILQEFDAAFNKLNTIQNAFIKATQDGLLKWRAENNSDPLIKTLEDLENSEDLISLKTTIINLRDLHELIFLTLNTVQRKFNIKLLPYNKRVQDFSIQNEKNLVFVYYCSTLKSIIDDSFVHFLEKQKTLQTQYVDSTFLLVNIETNLYHKEIPDGFEKWENHKLQNLVRRHAWPDGTSYDGEWEDDKRNGKGKYVWKDGSFYEGDWKDDKKDGKGQRVYSDGNTYDGDWNDDKRNGKGKYVWKDGSFYEGDWKDDKRDGKGKRVFLTGSSYDGDWKDDKKNGQGKYVWPDETSYEGEWKDDKKDGKGKCVSPDGSTYEGDWKDGKKHGQGKYIWPSGAFYDGEWKDGKQNGKGKYVWLDEGTYEGDWKDDKKNGKGKRVYSNGSTYDGEWKDDKRNGNGKNVWPDGASYDGDWKDDNMNGKGKYVWTDGASYDGEWKDDNMNGKGKRVSSDGSTYDGDWKNDKKNGKGKYVWPDGAFYDGDWKDDKENGKGKFVWPNGISYDGYWKDGNMTGKGKRGKLSRRTHEGDCKDSTRNGNGNGKPVWPEGTFTDRDWKDGNMNGKGKRVSSNASTYDGDRKEGKRNGFWSKMWN